MTSLKLEIPSPSVGRIPVLDELKGLAIAMVVFYHAGGVLSLSNTFRGDVGVDIFVILSGVGLGYGRGYKNFRDFFSRRILRILPLYWLALTSFLVASFYYFRKPFPTEDILLHYLGLHAWFGDVYAMSINDSFWFVSLILSLYLFHAALHSLEKRPDRLLLAGALISLTASLWFFFRGQAGTYAHLATRLPGFFPGLLLGKLLNTGKLELPMTPSLVVAFFLLTYVPNTQGIVFNAVPIGAAIMATYVFGWKRLVPNVVEKLTSRLLAFLGALSFEIFLFHQPLIREYNVSLASRWFDIDSPTTLSLLLGIAAGLAVTLVIAVGLHWLQERIYSPRRVSVSS